MTRHRTTIHSAILVQFSAMRSIGPGRSRCGRADPGVAQGFHLVVAHQNLRWDGVGSTRCSHKSLSLTLTTRGVQRGEPTDKPKAESTQNSRATRNCTESSHAGENAPCEVTIPSPCEACGAVLAPLGKTSGLQTRHLWVAVWGHTPAVNVAGQVLMWKVSREPQTLPGAHRATPRAYTIA